MVSFRCVIKDYIGRGKVLILCDGRYNEILKLELGGLPYNIGTDAYNAINIIYARPFSSITYHHNDMIRANVVFEVFQGANGSASYKITKNRYDSPTKLPLPVNFKLSKLKLLSI